MKIFIENEMFMNHISYTFETIFRCVQQKEAVFLKSEEYQEGEPAIYYGKRAPSSFRGIFIKEGYFFGDSYLKNEGIPELPLKRYEDIPVLFMDSNSYEPSITENTNYTEFNFDIIQSTFFIITGCEEIIGRRGKFDNHSRYFIENRILYKENFLHRPLINIYAHMLQEHCIRRNIMEKQTGKLSAYAHISHDVDYPYTHNILAGHPYAKNILERVPGVSFMRRLNNGFNILIQTEKELGISSSWYFKSGGNNLGFDEYYELQDDKILQLINNLKQKGDEIGWHYSYNAAYDTIQFRKEYHHFIESVGVTAVYGRNHYLRYMIPETWRIYSEMGIVYDATLGSAQHEGFIYGICTPFQLFDAVNGNKLNVWEIPLIVMDGTVCTKAYRGLSQEEVIQIVCQLIKEVKMYNGVFSLLWHNTSFRTFLWRNWENIYYEIMKLLSDNLICVTGRKIIDIYK